MHQNNLQAMFADAGAQYHVFFITKLDFQTNTSSRQFYQRAIITPVQMHNLIYNIRLQCILAILSFMFGYLLNGQAYFCGSECTECNMHKS